MPMSSMTMRWQRVIFAMALETVLSTVARPRWAVSDSRVNQATCMPSSIALCARASARWLLPVPDGPAAARFSARCTHSKVISACWVGTGIEDSSCFQEPKVFPVGRFARFMWLRFVAASRPLISSSSRMRTTSAGSQRWERAVASTSGAALRR